MDSRIIFLGTAGDAYVTGKQLRASGGIVLQSHGFQFHIDPGPGALVRAAEYGVNIRENTGLIVTSPEIETSSDLNAVIYAMTYAGLDVKGVLISNAAVLNGTESSQPILMPHYKKFLEKVIQIETTQRVGIELVEFSSLQTKNSPAFGIKLYTPDFCLVYSSDTALSKEVVKQYVKADILILNCTNPAMVKSDHGLCSAEVIQILKAVKPKLALITHFGKKMLEADPLIEARNIQRESKIQTLAAQDGLVIDPAEYAAKSKQKTLSSYDG